IFKQFLRFSVGFYDAEEIPRLGEMVLIVIAEVVCIGVTGKFQRWFFVLGLLLPFAVAVGFVVFCSAVISVHTHLPVAVESVVWACRLIHRNLKMIHSQAVALGIAVRKESFLQHFIGRKTDTGNNIGW